MTEAASDRIRHLAERLPQLGLASLALTTSAGREALREQMREAHHLNEAAALGVSQDDARMILNRVREPAVQRALMTPYPVDRDAMWQRVHDQLLRHVMGEPYEPFPERTEFFRRIGVLRNEDVRLGWDRMWSREFPDVAELGDDSPHVSVRELGHGEVIWSWVSQGQRRWQHGQETR